MNKQNRNKENNRTTTTSTFSKNTDTLRDFFKYVAFSRLISENCLVIIVPANGSVPLLQGHLQALEGLKSYGFVYFYMRWITSSVYLAWALTIYTLW